MRCRSADTQLRKVGLAAEDDYIYETDPDDEDRVIGAVMAKKVQWYQCEILHLSVHDDYKRKGVGTRLLEAGEERARELRARVAQCTIRKGNRASEGFFRNHGYKQCVSFVNRRTGNSVGVWQKSLVPK
jgi:ribosomal protein S18 acetylase RimI-like enzyme